MVNAPGALRSIDVPALCVASSEDLLIPSGDEGPRLRREMPRCRVEVLEGASHAALQKDECDLLEVMARNGFKPRAEQDPPPLSNDEGFMPPSAAELERAFESLEPLRRITSPVFFSTKANGQIVRGIDAVPLGTKGAPVLLVGNHQTLAPDLGFLVQEFIRERGTLVRGLAHPVVAGGGARAAAKAKEEESRKRKEDEEKKEKAVNEGDGGSNVSVSVSRPSRTRRAGLVRRRRSGRRRRRSLRRGRRSGRRSRRRSRRRRHVHHLRRRARVRDELLQAPRRGRDGAPLSRRRPRGV